MTAFDVVLTEIFDRKAELVLTLEEERELLATAALGGPEADDAKIRLLYAYARVLRKFASAHSGRLGVEEARQAAVEGMLITIRDFDMTKARRLAATVRDTVSNTLRETNNDAITVSTSTKLRVFRYMARAEGDAKLAVELAVEGGMERETFIFAREALSSSALEEETTTIDRATPVWASAPTDSFLSLEDRMMTAEALDALDPRSLDVVRHAYGFVDGEAMSAEKIRRAMTVRELGEERADAGESVISSATVKRVNTRALSTMREALGVPA